VSGLDAKPGPDTVVGVALSSDTPAAGTFACSDDLLNKLVSNIRWTQLANFIDIPTDCPQRDERLGWTGDAQIYVRTATLNCDVQAFFTKWLVDLCVDGQRADGQFPCVAPVKVAGPDGGPAWADAGVICPWTIYEVYGDRRVLEQHYAAMTRFIEFCRARCTPATAPAGEVPLLRRLAEHQGRHAQGRDLPGLLRLQHEAGRAGGRGARKEGGRGPLPRAVRPDQGRVQQGVRRCGGRIKGRTPRRAMCWPSPSTCWTRPA
jgi:hypothetical protein